MSEPDLPVISRGVVIVHTPQSIVRINRIDGARGLPHPRRGELPVVTGVDRGRVKNQDWNLLERRQL